jgi:hypothetical protein
MDIFEFNGDFNENIPRERDFHVKIIKPAMGDFPLDFP